MLSSFNEPDTVEMMDDEDSSSSSSNSDSDEDFKSANSNKTEEKKDKLKKLNKNSEDDDDDDEDDDEDDEIRSHQQQPPPAPLTSNNEMAMLTEYSDFKSSIFNDPVTNPMLDDNTLSDEDEERKRFQIELEFVQSLANPSYLNFLAQRGYFRQQTFLNYLKYLMYWKEPDYVKYIMYPQCLSLLELLQHEQFLKEIVNAQCSKFIDEQLLLIWSTYKKKRDWIRIDPTKIPDGIEKLFANENSNTSTTNMNNLISNNEDTFSAEAFLANEKF